MLGSFYAGARPAAGASPGSGRERAPGPDRARRCCAPGAVGGRPVADRRLLSLATCGPATYELERRSKLERGAPRAERHRLVPFRVRHVNPHPSSHASECSRAPTGLSRCAETEPGRSSRPPDEYLVGGAVCREHRSQRERGVAEPRSELDVLRQAEAEATPVDRERVFEEPVPRNAARSASSWYCATCRPRCCVCPTCSPACRGGGCVWHVCRDGGAVGE